MIHVDVQHQAAEILRAAEALAGCSVVEQNAGELADLLAREEGAVDGVALVVCVDDMRLVHSKPREWDVSYSVLATEFIETNRAKTSFTTALDAALAAADALDGPCGHAESVSHATPGDGVLAATLRMRGKWREAE